MLTRGLEDNVSNLASSTSSSSNSDGRPAPQQEGSVGEEPDTSGIKFELGDHVYQWRSYRGVPRPYQHHAIVIGVDNIEGDGTDDRNYMHQILTLADVVYVHTTLDEEDVEPSDCRTKVPTIASLGCRVSSTFANGGIMRKYTTNTKSSKWYKVEDGGSNRSFRRSRTDSSNDSADLVLSRANFLLSLPDCEKDNNSVCVPGHHAPLASSECWAVFCKTGVWSTLQSHPFWKVRWVASTITTVVGFTNAGVTTSNSCSIPESGVLCADSATTTALPLAATQICLLPSTGTERDVTDAAASFAVLLAS
jgi:hypothetical protein